MAYSLARDNREHVNAYLAGDLALAELQDWLVGATWNVEARGDPTAVDLTYDIKLALAELSRGDISPSEVCKRLREVVGTPVSAATPSK